MVRSVPLCFPYQPPDVTMKRLTFLAESGIGIPRLDERVGRGLPQGPPKMVCGSSGFSQAVLGPQFQGGGAPLVAFTARETVTQSVINHARASRDLPLQDRCDKSRSRLSEAR